MRLRQMARKLEINPDKIINLLAESGHSLENEANGKLTAEQVVIVESHYASMDELGDLIEISVEPEPLEEEVVEEIIEEVPVELEVPIGPPSDVTSQVSEAIVEERIEVVEPLPTVRLFKAVEEPADDPNIELIKAPVVKLEGLKVVGKIDLPEPKEVKIVEKPVEPKPETRLKIKPASRIRNAVKGQHENPVERERLRQEKIAARKKRDHEQKLKELKRENYIKQIKAKNTAPKAIKKKKVETPVIITSAPVLGQNKTQPTVNKPNKLRRLWGWLNGEYDNY